MASIGDWMPVDSPRLDGPNPASPSNFFSIRALPRNYPTDDAGFIQHYRSWVDQTIAAGGWAVETYHNWATTDNVSLEVTEAALQGHLADITTSALSLWTAPFGEVVRYIKERDGTTLSGLAVTANSITLDPTFSGDLTIFDESLTLYTAIPDAWDEAHIQIAQAGQALGYSIFTDANGRFVMYNCQPGGGTVGISVPEPGSLATVLCMGVLALMRRRRRLA